MGGGVTYQLLLSAVDARSDMETHDQQTRADGNINDNVSTTPAANVSAVNANANTAAFEEMLTTLKKKPEELEKLIGSLAKQNETQTARTRVVLPRGATKLHGRRLDFATSLDIPGGMWEPKVALSISVKIRKVRKP